MNTKERTKRERFSAVLIPGLALFFVLSLSLHSHALYLSIPSGKGFSQSKSAYSNHSTEFCSACRLSGNVKPIDAVNALDSNYLGILIGFLDFNVLIPSLLLESNKAPRSPPTV